MSPGSVSDWSLKPFIRTDNGTEEPSACADDKRMNTHGLEDPAANFAFNVAAETVQPFLYVEGRFCGQAGMHSMLARDVEDVAFQDL